MGDMADLYNGYYDREGDDEEVLENCTLVHETDKAYLIHHRGRQAWFPKSRSAWEPQYQVFHYEAWLDPNWEAAKSPLGTTSSIQPEKDVL